MNSQFSASPSHWQLWLSLLNFRILALGKSGRVGTASYHDDVVKTPDGWRVQHRVVTLRRR